ncbi:hypothetical protein HWV62_3705 [Athelia sp. TMB]|nr:hypothetical protein HWV62_3705 [Athelia sp. TMB]
MSTSQLNLVGAHGGPTGLDSPGIHRRFFLGPMPEKVVLLTEAQAHPKKKRVGWLQRSTSAPGDDDEAEDTSRLSAAIQEHAFEFFLRQGGHEEDWGEEEQESIRKEMLKRWTESQWGRAWKRRKAQGKDQQPASTGRSWVGGTFEIGNFLSLGVNVLDVALLGGSRYSAASTKRPGSSTRPSFTSHLGSSMPQSQLPSTSAVVGETVGTVPIELRSPASPQPVPLPSAEAESSRVSRADADIDSPAQLSTSSTTALLGENSLSTSARNAPVAVSKRAILKSAATLPAQAEINGTQAPSAILPAINTRLGKTVHYTDSPVYDGPAPPGEVLARTGSAVDDTSAGAADAAAPGEILWGDVVMRDRMLVRASYSHSETLGNCFDEKQNRTTSHLRYEDWSEVMTVWRKDRLELYEDYSMPFKERIMGHKHLAFIIPLKTRTRLSLYSFVDLTFCITCPPCPVSDSANSARSLFHRSKEGTNIFVFKLKSRSRAQDWMWALWRHLGGEVPPYIEIRCPAMESRVKIDLPSALMLGDESGMATFTRQTVIELCREVLKNYRDWELIIEREVNAGKHLELAWRTDTTLDWVWLDEDIEEHRRGCAVLWGLSLKHSPKAPHLEIRLGEHRQATVSMRNGSKLHEPPAIEGYLDRIKPNTQSKEPIYMASHDGYIFSLAPSNANPPSPPGLHPPKETTETLRETEVRRGVQQVMHAMGVCDVRAILTVRRAFHQVAQQSHTVHDTVPAPNGSGSQDQNLDWLGTWDVETNADDEHDIGGDEGLSRSTDKPKLKMQRSFELLLKSGRVIRFEAYSCRVALEWIQRLRDLVVYWKQRHRADAREEMDLSTASSQRPRLTPHLLVKPEAQEAARDASPDLEGALPALNSLYSWCVLDGCKAVLKTGKLHTRKGLHGYYKNVQLFLVSGHLIRYRITPKSSLHRRQYKAINLLDAYVTSGYFAALKLPRGQYDPQDPSVPRRYQDGLEADDLEEDMLFIVWYRPHAPAVDDIAPPPDLNASSTVSALSAKRKLVIFKTRSKLERDAWCWAINSEIEKLIRAGRDREEKLRQTGGLVKI